MNLDALESKRHGRPRSRKSGFIRFLESEAEKNPLMMEGRINGEEALREAELLASRIIADDLEIIRRFWRNRNFALIALALRRYGLEFKGVMRTEHMIKEFLRIIEGRKDSRRV